MSKIIVVCENAFFSKSEENAVILNYDNGMYYGLDSIGSEYWELLQEYKEFELVIEKMHSKYQDVPRVVLESDLNELIRELIGKGLVKVE